MDNNIETNKAMFKLWVDEYTNALYSWAFYKTSNKELAEDLVQDTFLSAYNSLDKFSRDSQPKTWLMSILNHKIIDHYRKNARSKEYAVLEEQAERITDSMFSPNGAWSKSENASVWQQEDHLLDNHEFNKVLRLCIEDLPENWRYALTSKYLTEKNAEEICQDLEITTTNYWKIIQRAKLMMKKCLETHWK
jgi:RNA polymerase sigma-70 factor (ECF subfamily)